MPPPQPIRIRSFLSEQSDGLLEAKRERLDAAVQEAVRTVSSLLSVHGPLRLSRDVSKYCKFLWKNSSAINYNRCGRANSSYRAETCLDVIIPDDHLDGCDIYPQPDSPLRTVLRPEGAGLPDTDFLLYVLVRATDKCRAEPGVLAYAAHCRTDHRGRPLAGVAVICRETLRGAAYRHPAAVQTVIHELLHTLGFSKDLFSTWRRCSASSHDAAGCSPRGKVTHSDGRGQIRVYTPAVVSALQTHLQSADPGLGAPLENQGAPLGGASSHWEARVLQGSIMAAALGHWATVRIDPVTLAALQDSGWYRVDPSRAQSLVWGRGEGSSFGSVLKCNSSSFFCTGSGLGCHFLHLHKGACQTDQYLEGCRLYKPLTNGSECFIEENSRFPDVDHLRGELFGPDSRCFFSSLIRRSVPSCQPQPGGPGASVEGLCYRHRCTGPNRFQIQVSGSGWVNCPAGGSIQVKGYQGSVSCPDRRLCLHSDVFPLSGDVNPFSSSNTRRQ
ncbi:leishmanolysin-like peptidase 2 [Salarias fasciatus]|uniref:leishmanolysin-like peptidase 2 n=1 Tax=Salarias fasciatus TaxID=181472 RepID=UPI001176DD71|nr:leishmanolysin-like peptidase 2 [Salarias fasciatus]